MSKMAEHEAVEAVQYFQKVFGNPLGEEQAIAWAELVMRTPRSTLPDVLEAVKVVADEWTRTDHPPFGIWSEEIERAVHAREMREKATEIEARDAEWAARQESMTPEEKQAERDRIHDMIQAAKDRMAERPRVDGSA